MAFSRRSLCSSGYCQLQNVIVGVGAVFEGECEYIMGRSIEQDVCKCGPYDALCLCCFLREVRDCFWGSVRLGRYFRDDNILMQ